MDARFLFSPSDSPSLETFKLDEGYRLKMTGPCHMEPALNFWQVNALDFLGWRSPDECECACFWTDFLDSDSASERFLAGMGALYTIYGVSENCRLLGSNDHVKGELLKIPGTRLVRRDGTVRFSQEVGRVRTREDLR